MNLYFSRKFIYSLYEDNVKFAQITRECRNTLLFYWIVYIICIDEALFCHVLTLFIF